MTAARPDMPLGIEDRNADVWESLLAIADAVGGDWPKRARDAAVALVGAAKDAEPSLGIRLLGDLKTIFATSTSAALPTEVILRRLTELPEAPWGGLGGKPITDRSLALRLRQYGVKSKDVRVEGRDSPLKGYAKADLHDAWLRYLPPARDAEEARQARQVRPTPEGGGFSQENVADVEMASATVVLLSATPLQTSRILSATRALSATEIPQRNQALSRMSRLCQGSALTAAATAAIPARSPTGFSGMQTIAFR